MNYLQENGETDENLAVHVCTCALEDGARGLTAL